MQSSSSPIQVHFLSGEEIEEKLYEYDSEEESDDSKSDEKPESQVQFQPEIKNVILDPFTASMQKIWVSLELKINH